MKDQANNVFKSIQQFWKAQSQKRKIIFCSVFVGMLVLAIVLSLILNRKDYAVLFTSLDKA